MEFTKFVIHEGRVASERNVSSSELQPGLQHAARDTLARMKSGATAARIRLPGGPPFLMRLGTPPLPEPEEMERDGPELDDGSLDDARCSNFFCIEFRDRVALFHIIPADGPEHDGGRFGMIAGSWIDVREQDWAEHPDAFPVEELQRRFEETMRRTFAGRPALVCTWEASNAISRFADCLAFLMLSPTLPAN
jgi:hypothetical protein